MDDIFDEGAQYFAPLASTGYEPNDSFATAVTIAEGTHAISGENIDWFRFDALSGTMNFSMTPGGTNPIDLHLELYDDLGRVRAADLQPGTASESFSFLNPVAGTYYLKVYSAQFVDSPPSGFALEYTLDIDLPEDTGPAPGDTFETALEIAEGTQAISGENVDWFRFDTVTGDMSFSMTPTGANPIDLNLELYDSNGIVRAANIQGGTATESFSFLADVAGTYYLKVLSAAYGDTPPNGYELNYALTVDLPEEILPGPNDPGETRATATPITPGTYTFSSVGTDWFRFDTGPGDMDFVMTPIGADAKDLNLELYDANGNRVQQNFRNGVVAEEVSFQATANQTYYLHVYWAPYPEAAPNGYTLDYSLTIDLPEKTWALPVDFGPVRNASVSAFDIDNDGLDEIFIGTSKALDAEGNEVRPAGLIVLEDDGTIKWTRTFAAAEGPDIKTGKTYNTTSVSTAPVFSDVDGDGQIDILVGVGADNRGEFEAVGQPGDLGGLYALDATGETIWFHEVRDSFGHNEGPDGRPDGVYGAPRIFDVDADGAREVIFTSWDHYLYVLNGKTGAVEREVNLHDTAGATPGLADLNRDGVFELVVPSDVTDNALAGLSQQGGILHVLTNYGQAIVPGFDEQVDQSTNNDYRGKFEEQSLWSSPQIVDLDRDGNVEIVVGTGNFFLDDRGQYVKVWNSDGSLRYELPTTGRVLAAPVIADLDGDGSMEIIAATTSGHVHAWNAAGTELFDTHVIPFGRTAEDKLPISRHPVAVDIDNANNDLEILVGVGSQLIVLDSDGTQLTNLDRSERAFSTYAGSPVVKDIDGDGKLDLITGGTNDAHDQAIIYRWENPFDVTSSSYRTGVYQESQSLHEIQAFVERFYSTILGREADAGGKNLWTDMLYTGVRAGADVARGFIFSPEFTARNTSDDEFLNVLYSAFFNRAADEGGFNLWKAQLDSGVTRASVLEGFIGSQEFANLANSFGILTDVSFGAANNAATIVGDPTDASLLRGGAGDNVIYDEGTGVAETSTGEQDIYGQVYRLYGATLGRVPDSTGFIAWFEGLNTGAIQLQQAAGGFVASQEFQNTYGALTDSEFVELLYQNVLGRSADAAGLNGWLALLGDGMERSAVVLGFSESTEYRNNTTPALDRYMGAIEPKWVDVIEGGAGNDQMNGGTGADVFVFRASEVGQDVIHGFEPWDELQLSGFGFSTAADAQRWMTQVGADVVFSHPTGQQITFLNTSLADMSRVKYNLS